MPRVTYGPDVKARAKRLLEALLAFVNDEVEGCDNLELHFRWQDKDSANPSIVVETKLRVLEYLTQKDKHPEKLTKDQIRQALNQHLKEFLGIVEDNRAKTQGEEDWHFTLKLWGKDTETNLRQFELEWEQKRPDKSKKLEATFVETRRVASPTAAAQNNSIDWYRVCIGMLEKQRETQKFRRQITGRGLGHEVDVYVPLGLTEPKAAPRRNEEFSPLASEGMRQYQLTETESKKYEYQKFLDEIIGKPGKNITIAGEPGAGKTTWLDRIAIYLDKAEKAIAFPIAIPLESLGEKTLEEFLLQNWLKDALPLLDKDPVKVTPALEEKFIQLFNSGKVWLLLDGADEMRVSAPLQQIAKQLTGWVDRARVVLTCRLNVWEANPNILPNFQTFRTLNFEDEQVREFIGQWFAKSDKPELGKALQEKLAEAGKERIRDVAKNPLRVAMLCKLWYFNQGDLPETRAGLYEQFSRDFYHWKPHDLLTGNWEKQQELHAALGKVAVEAIEQKCPLREGFVRKVMGQPLFQLACEVGWLNQVYKDAKTGDPVYAFFHLTFQEYFAALAVDDWHFFLNHFPDNLMQGVYRIFEPKWKEPILLWLGREDVPSEQKEEFIQALVKFEDGTEHDFYRYPAYFLAAAGIAEFKECPRADEIVAQIVKWSFGYFNIEKQAWQTFLAPIEEGARTALPETNRKKAISVLVELIRSSQDEYTRRRAAESLGKIDPGNPTAIQALVELIGSSKHKKNRRRAVESLGKIGAGNQTAIQALVELIGSSQDESTRRLAAESLGKIDAGNETAIRALVELIGSSQDESTRRLAADSLGKIGAGNETAIQALVELIGSSQDKYTRMLAADSLGKIDAGNETAIQALVELIGSSQDKYTRRLAAESLGKIDAGNETAIRALVELIGSSQDESTRRLAADSLGKIGAGNETAIQALVKFIGSSQDESTRRLAAYRLGEIDAGNETAIQALVKLIGSSQDESTRRLAAYSLGKIDPGNPTAIQALVELIGSSKDESTRSQAADSLKKILLKQEQMAGVVTALKDYLSDEAWKNDFRRFKHCYNVIWHCAQTLPYPIFYQAWHHPQVTAHPEVAETAGVGFTADSIRSNLTELPLLLGAALVETRNFASLQLICIDGSKFIDRDNPAAKIYNEMRRHSSPKSFDGTPKTMADLQAYWDELTIDSEKPIVLVFYNPTPPAPKGFSEVFLDALSKFDGAICTVTDEPMDGLSLQQFDAGDPHLVENIVKWMRGILLEGL